MYMKRVACATLTFLHRYSSVSFTIPLHYNGWLDNASFGTAAVLLPLVESLKLNAPNLHKYKMYGLKRLIALIISWSHSWFNQIYQNCVILLAQPLSFTEVEHLELPSWLENYFRSQFSCDYSLNCMKVVSEILSSIGNRTWFLKHEMISYIQTFTRASRVTEYDLKIVYLHFHILKTHEQNILQWFIFVGPIAKWVNKKIDALIFQLLFVFQFLTL